MDAENRSETPPCGCDDPTHTHESNPGIFSGLSPKPSRRRFVGLLAAGRTEAEILSDFADKVVPQIIAYEQ